MAGRPSFDQTMQAYQQADAAAVAAAAAASEAGTAGGAAAAAAAASGEEAKELKRKVTRLKNLLLLANQHITKFQEELAAKDKQLRVLLPSDGEASRLEVR